MLTSNGFLIVDINSKAGGALFKSCAVEMLSILDTARKKSEVKDKIFHHNVFGSQYDREKLQEVHVLIFLLWQWLKPMATQRWLMIEKS